MVDKVFYKGDNSGTGPSPNLWADCPWNEAILDPNKGYGLFDDFLNFSDHISDQSVQGYDSYIDTGVTIQQLAGVVGGQVEIAGNDADNDEGVLSTHGPIVQVSDTAGSDKALWFEARVAKASIADNALGMFIGLAFDHGNGVPVAKTLCLTDNDAALGAFSFLGFHVDNADGDALDTVYKADGQAAQVVQAGVQTLAASTFYKLGLKYDPKEVPSKRIKFFVDGTEQTSYVTATNIAAATFPDAEPLGLVFCTKVGTAAEVKAQLDWWRVFQER